MDDLRRRINEVRAGGDHPDPQERAWNRALDRILMLIEEQQAPAAIPTPPPQKNLEMARRGRLGASATNSRHDGRTLTSKARRTFIEGFATEARSQAEARGETITDEEAKRRGELLRRAHYAGIARHPRKRHATAPTF